MRNWSMCACVNGTTECVFERMFAFFANRQSIHWMDCITMSRVQSHFSQMQQVAWLTCTLHTRRVTHYASVLALFSSILLAFFFIFFDCVVAFLGFSLVVRLSIACLLVQCIVINKPNDYVLAALHMDSLVRFSFIFALSLARTPFRHCVWSCARTLFANPAEEKKPIQTVRERVSAKCWQRKKKEPEQLNTAQIKTIKLTYC